MRKHALGFVFFVAIVSLFAAGYTVFRTYSIPEIEVVDYFEIPSKKTSCFPRSRSSEVRIIQAIADLSDNTLVLDLSIDGREKDKGFGRVGDRILFSFHRVDTDGATHIRSEERMIVAADEAANGIVRYKFDWLGDIGRLDNLYVMARSFRSKSESGMNIVAFSKEKATPVVLIAGQ